MATSAELRYRRRAMAIVRRMQRLDPATMRDVMRQVRVLRREVLEVLGTSDSWTTARLPAILREVEVALQRWVSGSSASISSGLRSAAGYGNDLADALFTASGNGALVSTPGVLPVIVQSQVEALSGEIATLVQQVATETRSKIAREIQGAVLGVQRPGEAMDAISRIVPGIRQPIRNKAGDVVGHRYAGPAARAQTIVQTELPRAFSAATDIRLRQASAELPELEKEWVSVLGPSTRDSHAAAHGQRRPVKEPFSVGGHRLMYPRDPTAPAAEVINCQCVQIPVMPSWRARQAPQRARP